ncbi:MAG TPA: winged helix-turn-helix domain-containing protein [Candidatus Thermoplasmatota archaeon]|nr:winged helix-turn-helix domain-containing protein [Candidatus Thermoplasmatota archaeon]
MARRERATILAALLLAVEEGHVAGHGITRVASRANLPYDRTTSYLGELAAAGLVTRGPAPALTDDGKEALRRYQEWAEVMGRFGLE